MKKVQEYKLLQAISIDELNEIVNDHILNSGWELYGNVVVSINPAKKDTITSNHFVFHQAVIQTVTL